MRERNRAPMPTLAILLAVLLLPVLLPADAAAGPQEEDRQVRREIVVVGSQPVHHQLILDQLANRGYLGVHLLHLTPELRRHFGAAPETGVLVSRVAPDSPAAEAGVAVGDVITSVDREPVWTTSQIVGRIGRRREGEEIELGIVRDRSPLELRATLTQAARRQVDLGQFVWQDDKEGTLVIGMGPEGAARALTVDPELIERVITVDPETINESVSKLLERIEAREGIPGHLRLDSEHRKQLEKRIAELEARLQEMERQIHLHRDADRHRDD